jgi:hypothetical protein
MLKKTTLFMAFIAIAGNAQITNIGNAINKAGKQRMLVQRMTKDYMSIGAGIKVKESTTDIDDITALFNETQRDLTLFAKDKDTKNAITYVNDLWANFRLKMANDPDVVNAESIISEASILTNACNSVVEKLQGSNTTAQNTKLVNICGKQRLNMQRLAMLYIAKSWGVQYKFLDSDIRDVISSFELNLGILTNTKENTDEIKQSLAFQKSEWEFLKKSLESENLKPGNIYGSTNIMTKDFDGLVTQYEKIVIDNKGISSSK